MESLSSAWQPHATQVSAESPESSQDEVVGSPFTESQPWARHCCGQRGHVPLATWSWHSKWAQLPPGGDKGYHENQWMRGWHQGPLGGGQEGDIAGKLVRRGPPCRDMREEHRQGWTGSAWGCNMGATGGLGLAFYAASPAPLGDWWPLWVYGGKDAFFPPSHSFCFHPIRMSYPEDQVSPITIWTAQNGIFI
jgi:hypothetical protein